MSTKSPRSDKQYVWESEADSSSYVIREETNPENLLSRGTEITLYLRVSGYFCFFFVALFATKSQGLAYVVFAVLIYLLYLLRMMLTMCTYRDEVKVKKILELVNSLRDKGCRILIIRHCSNNNQYIIYFLSCLSVVLVNYH